MITPAHLTRTIALLAGLSPFLAAQRPADLESKVRAIETIDPNDLFYARSNDAFEALAAEWTVEQARALTADEDPRVRAIALVVLHEQIGPRAMPVLVQFLDDQGPAPPAPQHFAEWLPGGKRPTTPQSVGQIALSLFAQYLPIPMVLARSRSRYLIEAEDYRTAYADYVRTRAARPHCFVWTKVAMQRAGGGIMPTPAERLPRIAAVRQQIDAIPAPARHWYLLALANDWGVPGREALATEAELVAAAQALGPDAVFTVLRGFGPADVAPADSTIDPDLSAVRQSPFTWLPLALFLLRHGEKVIPAERCAEWLAVRDLNHQHVSGGLGTDNYGITSADWFRVAAVLQPERAREHIDAGFAAIPRDPGDYQKERGRLVLVDVARGDGGLSRAVEWFYGEWPQPDFIAALARPEHARLLWTLIADARFDTLPWGLIPEVARACNAHVPGQEPFPFEELRGLHHPHGIRYGDFHRGDPQAPHLVGLGFTIAEAEAKYPAETAQLRQVIGGLRDRMRALAAARLR